jgi:hypothetical protein
MCGTGLSSREKRRQQEQELDRTSYLPAFYNLILFEGIGKGNVGD